MKLRVLTVGKSRCGWAQEAVTDYDKRLRRWGGVVEESVKAQTFRGDVDAVRLAESERLIARLAPNERLVALDERGENLSTEAFARLVELCRDDATPLAFALGGAYGHDAILRQRAWRVIRLSSLVLNHEVARVVLYEQLYRSLDWLEGGPYHH